MKYFGWPRPPMLLAFILAPIIEINLTNAISIYGVGGALTDGLTLVIVGVAVFTALVFLRAMRQVEREEERAEALLEEEAGNVAQPVRTAGRGRWKWDYAVHLGIVVLCAVWAWDAKDYPRAAWRFPIVLSLGALTLTALHLVLVVVRGEKPRAIMDLRMMSTSTEGVRKAAVRLGGLMALFIAIGVTLHLAYAALALAVLVPVFMLKGLGKYPIAAATGGIVFLFITIVLDNILYVVWPMPFVTGWHLPWGIALPFTLI
jgi:hypothetical protein